MDDSETKTAPQSRPRSNAREITLTEIWLILLRRRLLVLAVVALCTLAGLAIGLTRVDVYPVTVAVEIGQISTTGAPTAVEETEETVARVEEAYIPQLYVESPELADFGIAVDSPTGSRLVAMSAKGPASESSRIGAALSGLADMLVDEHEAVIANYRTETETRIEELSKQIGKRNSDLLGLETQRSQLQQVLTNSEGMDSVPVALAHVEVERIIAGHREALGALEQHLHRARTTLINIRSSRRVSSAIVSARSSGPGTAVVVLLGILAGIVFAVVAALCTEFITRAAHQARAEG